MEKRGRAYALFYCKEPLAAINAELPRARHMAQTPSELELALSDDLTDATNTSIKDLVQEARDAGCNYLITATYANATNEKAAAELGDVVNSLYTSPLYAKGEQFIGGIAYEQDGKYVFRE